MSTLIIVLIILTVVFTAGCIWSWDDYNLPDIIPIISILGLIFTVLFGWFLGSSLSSYYTKKQPIDCSIEKTSREVIVYPKEHHREIFNLKYDYDNINDSTQFYYLIEYNHYGFEIQRTLTY